MVVYFLDIDEEAKIGSRYTPCYNKLSTTYKYVCACFCVNVNNIRFICVWALLHVKIEVCAFVHDYASSVFWLINVNVYMIVYL